MEVGGNRGIVMSLHSEKVGACWFGRWCFNIRCDPEFRHSFYEDEPGVKLSALNAELRRVRERVVVTTPVFAKVNETKSRQVIALYRQVGDLPALCASKVREMADELVTR